MIRALTVGGAERQLVGLARGLTKVGCEVHVVVFYRSGSYLEEELVSAGVPLVVLEKQGRWDLSGFVSRLNQVVSARALDVVYSFLPTANVLAAVLWGWRDRPVVVWGVRSASSARRSHDWLGRGLVFAERCLVGRASAVIANSRQAMAGDTARGCLEERLHLIPNGLDPDEFYFDGEARQRWRSAWGVGSDHQVIGFAGRLDPVKGLDVLFAAVRTVQGQVPGVEVVVAGEGNASYTDSLRKLSRLLGIDKSIRWLGNVRDMSGFYSAIDLLCLPSLTEGCSNVLAEALACGTPAVATRVGDNSLLVPDPDLTVEPGRSDDLARVLLLGLRSASPADRERLREGILHRLALPVMVQRTATVLRDVAFCERRKTEA